jgi:hypothetical protein
VASFLYRLVERLRAEASGLSRNRHFHTFSAPNARRALRIHKQLRSLERDIAEHGPGGRIEVTRGGGGVCVRLEVPAMRAVRTATLTPEEYELLAASPQIRGLLAAAEMGAG